MNKAGRNLSVIAVVFLLVGCVPGEKMHFSDFRDFDNSNAKDWFQGVVPESSKDIDVWYELESGLVRASFLYSGAKPIPTNAHYLRNSDLAVAKSSYPDLKEKEMRISYSCSSKEIGQDEQVVRYTEIRFWGDTGERMFYWNSMSNDVFDAICNSIS